MWTTGKLKLFTIIQLNSGTVLADNPCLDKNNVSLSKEMFTCLVSLMLFLVNP